MFVCPSERLSVCTLCMSVCVCLCLRVCLCMFVYMSSCMSVCMSVFMSVYMSGSMYAVWPEESSCYSSGRGRHFFLLGLHA